MQALVSKAFGEHDEMERQAKRFKSSAYTSSSEFVTMPKRTPLHRLKLQFPNLDEEVSCVYNHPTSIDKNSAELIRSY